MAYADEVLADSPVGYWRLGDASGTNANDEISTNDGTYAGGFTLAVTGALTGDTDTAVTLNGTDGRVTIPATFPTLAASDMTCEAWIKTAATGTAGQMIFGAYQTASPFPGWGFIFQQGTADGKLGFFDATSALWRKSTGTITDTNWHHVAVTVSSGGSTTFYIDGTAAGTVAGNAPNSFTGPKAIGSTGNNVTSALFNGTLDEVAVYSTVLSGTRILAHYTAGTTNTNQMVRPDADTATTGWTSTPLFSKVNDSSDSTFITGTLA